MVPKAEKKKALRMRPIVKLVRVRDARVRKLWRVGVCAAAMRVRLRLAAVRSGDLELVVKVIEIDFSAICEPGDGGLFYLALLNCG